MQVKNLKKTYGDRIVLDIDACEFIDGKIYAIIGANGSGKSTLLKELSAKLPKENKQIAYMPQKNHPFKTTVLKNILISSKSKKEDLFLAEDLMKEMKIDHLSSKQAHRLSGGETARMALCRLFVTKAPVLLLDEPTAAMDIESTLLSENLIRKYNLENNATIIMVTHSINQAIRLADEIIYMRDGKIIEKSSPEILKSPQTKELKEFLDFFSN